MPTLIDLCTSVLELPLLACPCSPAFCLPVHYLAPCVMAEAWTSIPGRKKNPFSACSKRQPKEDGGQGQWPTALKKKYLQKYRQMKSNRLLNDKKLSVPLLHKGLGGRSEAHVVGRCPNSQRVIDRYSFVLFRVFRVWPSHESSFVDYLKKF